MAKVLLIGIGDKTRGDDGIGPIVAELLTKKIRDARVEIMQVKQLTPDLAEKVSQAELVIFIDAAVDAPPGSIGERVLEPGEAPNVMTHQIGTPQLLALAQVTYGKCPKARAYSLGVAWMGFGHKLSPDVLLSVPDLIKRIVRGVNEYLGTGQSFFRRPFGFRWGS